MGFRLGVDVGGTFTDLALYDADGNRLEFAKTPSTPENQAVGVASGIAELARRYGVVPEQVEFFIHGTTVATNTLLERKGASMALVVTAGFRDVLQIGRQERPSLYDWRIRRPEPLAPRRLWFEVAERMLYTGEVMTPLAEAEIERVAAELAAADVDAVAVCLLHSYANPEHERALGEALRRSLRGVTVALSHEVLPEFKEYERMSTTAINAYVAPVMERYLRRLERTISDEGLKSELYIMQSNGGTMGVETAIERPVHTIMSGPAAGVIGAAAIARQAGESNAISIDMGGTSFDVSLCYEGEVRQTQESEIERLPIRVPMVDVHTLGAGAAPGPACYGSGGAEATVTDANVVLGRLGESGLLGGAMPLDAELARRAVRERVAEPLGIGVEEAAEGIVQVVNASMVKGIRVVSVSKGYDPRDFCLVAFGGAGPLHVSELAEEMDIPRVLVPVAPGVTSALGLLVSDLRHDFARTVLRPGSDITPAELTRWFEGMEGQAVEQMAREGAARDRVTLARTVDARYVGQGYELQVAAASGEFTRGDVDEITVRFHEAHERSYGYAIRDNAVEVVNVRVTAVAAMPRPELVGDVQVAAGDASRAVTRTRRVYFRNEAVETRVYDRGRLAPGDTLAGPAIVEQLDSTTVVWPGQWASVDGARNLVLTRG